MKNSILSLLLITFVLLLSACGKQQLSTPGGAAPDSTRVEIAYADEAFLAAHGTYAEFVDYASAYQVKVAVTANNTLKNVKYLELSFVDAGENGDIKFDIVKELYTVEELPSQSPLVLDMTFEGSIPNRGISYTDANGVEKRYVIQMSGEDGSLMLTEFVKQ